MIALVMSVDGDEVYPMSEDQIDWSSILIERSQETGRMEYKIQALDADGALHEGGSGQLRVGAVITIRVIDVELEE